LSYALIFGIFGWELYSLKVESVIFNCDCWKSFCFVNTEDESVGIWFDLEVLLNWFERFSDRIDFVVNWERWDSVADGFDVCEILLELGNDEEIVERIFDGFRDEETLWLRLLRISLAVRDFGGTDIDWFDNGLYVLDELTFCSFWKGIDDVSVWCLFVIGLSLFSTLDWVIIEFDWIGDSSFCDKTCDILDDLVDVFDCS